MTLEREKTFMLGTVQYRVHLAVEYGSEPSILPGPREMDQLIQEMVERLVWLPRY